MLNSTFVESCKILNKLFKLSVLIVLQRLVYPSASKVYYHGVECNGDYEYLSDEVCCPNL